MERAMALLGPSFTRELAWSVAPPTYRGGNPGKATGIGQQLRCLAMINQGFAKDLNVFLTMARWSHELARLKSHQPVSIARLLSNPEAINDREAPLQAVHQSTDRLHALMEVTADTISSDGKRAVLKALFGACLARLDASASPQDTAPHLALDHLPQKVIAREFVCSSSLLQFELGMPFMTRQYAPLYALTVCLPRFDPGLRFLVVLHIVLASPHWMSGVTEHVRQFLHAHNSDATALYDRAQRWRDEFLEAPAGHVPSELAQEVLGTLTETPVLHLDACLRALARFCSDDALRALATDEVLVNLVHRAMAEIGADPNNAAELQLDLLCAELPKVLGVAAFNRLRTQQRLALVNRHHGHAFNPYMVAVVDAIDIPFAQRQAALKAMIARLELDNPAHSALPELCELRTRMDQELAAERN
jgi:hypothetical protein